MKMLALQADIYEMIEGNPVLVVTHIFYGKDDKQLIRLHKAHMETDSFYRAAMKAGRFRGISLQVHTQTYEVII